MTERRGICEDDVEEMQLIILDLTERLDCFCSQVEHADARIHDPQKMLLVCKHRSPDRHKRHAVRKNTCLKNETIANQPKPDHRIKRYCKMLIASLLAQVRLRWPLCSASRFRSSCLRRRR
jgi:hypothetical protein